jgi:hypothetical protein
MNYLLIVIVNLDNNLSVLLINTSTIICFEINTLSKFGIWSYFIRISTDNSLFIYVFAFS